MEVEASLPTRQAVAIKGRSAPLKVTGKLRKAIEDMVWTGARRPEAAERAGLTDHGLRAALKKPHVKAAYLAELDVLRTSERARNIHTLVDVRDQTGNQMARVNAVKALEQLDEQPGTGRSNAPQLPGLVVQIINNGQAAVEAKVIEPDATE